MRRWLAAAGALLLLPVVVIGAAVGSVLPSVGGAPMPAGGALGLAAAAQQAGFAGQALRMAVAVGLAESGGNPHARHRNPPTPGCPGGSIDRGGWQLNSCYHPEVSDACADDLPCAARAAYRISARGTNWRPWTTYKTGAWRSELATADRAIAALAEGAPSGYGTPGPCGLSPATDYAKHLVTELFGVTDIGGCALGGHIEGSDHYPDANGQAHAIDVMTGTDQALGQRIADWMIANAGPLHVKYVIYNHRIWTPDRGWHPYRHPACRSSSVCSPTLMHEDHVHLSSQLGF